MKKITQVIKYCILGGVTLCCLIIFNKLYSQHKKNYVTQTTYNVREIASAPWDSTNGLPYRQGPGFNFGATSFAILDKEQIAYLCNSSAEIIIVGPTKRISNRIPLSVAPTDFMYENNRFYVLSEFKLDIYDQLGNIIKSITLDNSYLDAYKIARFNNSTYLLLPSGNSVLVETNGNAVKPLEVVGWMTGSGDRIKGEMTGTNSFWVTVFTPSGDEYKNSYTEDKKVVAVLPIGASKNRIVLEIQTYDPNSRTDVERKIESIELEKSKLGKALFSIKVPDVYYVYSKRDLLLSNDAIYNMITAPDGVFVFRLSETTNQTATPYPTFLTDKPYHFNDHLLQVQ